MAGYSVAALNLTFWDGLTAAGLDKSESYGSVHSCRDGASRREVGGCAKL